MTPYLERPESRKKKIAIVVGTKGRGSNMANIIAACEAGTINAQVAGVISPLPNTPAIWRAQALRVPVKVAPGGDRHTYHLGKALAELDPFIICLAGYMKLFPEALINQYRGRILNIHPSLLPKYGGKGMYGKKVHEAVLAAGETETGCTVHKVTANYDEGPIVAQRKVPVMPDDTPETLANRVLDAEHLLYIAAIQKTLSLLG